ncbi:MAG: aminotransferase class I/II-fold pyridoxal phosphate-dependent enzyme [Oscillospiraceae bacterium]|nr:aminotransferase class I/II-fold pyridoxal phosphate-dependent enzyme [Oscillospiraceae bacterium]MDD6084832.1 aminotransferase class I/II-fold pyridoxal phosphate-dependent enzyme [Oscillospiraceae bacterium]MDY3258461.1 aminotransferase class I/II-fold pyridoxal phosphate-dependent enzyme [Ruminococcus callidus]
MNYDSILSEKCKKMKPSGIRRFFDLAATMDNVISLGVGEPDFSTPWTVRKTAIETLERKRIIYTANAGLADLRKSISDYIYKKESVRYNPDDEIIVTVGGSEAIDLAIRSIVNPGDEVMIVEPCFVCYAPLVELMNGVPVPLVTKAEDKFKLKADELKKAITPKTKLLILPYPNNPTGAIMTKEDLEPIAEVLKDTNIMVLTDEIYSEMTYGRKHFSIISLPEMKERTIYVNGFSKAFAMTGWRLGYVAAPEPVAKQMLKIHQYGIMSSPTVSQYAAITALEECENDVANMVSEYNMRRRFLVDGFNRIGLDCFEPEGAFYIFPSIESTGLTSEEFCEKLLYEKNVAVVPGSAFGASGEGHIRISYAYSLKHLTTALERIEEFVKECRK